MENLNSERDNIISLKPKAAGPVSDLILDFTVSTHSVVATAKVKVKTAVKRFRIDWGDGTSTHVDTVLTHILHNGPISILPDGTFKIKHAYDVSDDGSSFTRIILLAAFGNSGSDFKIQNITIVPKYSVSHSDIYFRLIDYAEVGEAFSEWEVSLNSTYQPVSPDPVENIGEMGKWSFDFPEYVIGIYWYRLEGSTRSHNLIKGDTMRTAIKFRDIDTFFDDYYSMYLSFDISKETEEITLNDGQGMIQIRFYQQVTLIRPLPATGLPDAEE